MALVSYFRLHYYVAALALAAAVILVTKYLTGKRSAPLPPGPKGKPIIGNLKDLPPPGAQEWQHWLKHKDVYGPLSSITVFGQTSIVFHSVKDAQEVMSKRSVKHSSRPSAVFASELSGWGKIFVSLPNNSLWRAYRKNVHAVIGSPTIGAQFWALQDVEVRRFLLRVLETPQKFIQHIRTEAGAIILKITYGYTIESDKPDPLVEYVEQALVQFSKASDRGVWLVDVLPILKHLPAWIPGAGFQRTARRNKQTLDEVAELPYKFVKEQMAKGQHESSFVSNLLEKGNLTEEEDYVVKFSAASLYTGGADTTVSSLACFFLAMTIYPEAQRKAQEEIDRVIGHDRLPGFKDRSNLPYVNAVVKEILRWHPVAPMGTAHKSTEDDIYKGYFIPKGALLLPNIWWMMHDPETYSDPMSFKPERFLGDAPETDPNDMAFGFGRRVCAGKFLADSSIYLTIAQSLAVFNVEKVLKNGKPVEPELRFENGQISHPAPFETNIKPRSSKHEELIRSVQKEHPLQQSDSKYLGERTHAGAD